METTTIKSKKEKKPKLPGFFSLKIKIKNSFPLHSEDLDSDECSECIEEYEGEILYELPNTPEHLLVGKFSFGILNATRAMNNHFDAMSTFDVGGEAFEFYQVMYEYPTYKFNDFIQDALSDELFGSNGAYISSIEILPEFRGYDLCKKIMVSIVNFLEGKVDIVVMKSFPLQFQSFIVDKRGNKEEIEWWTKMRYYDGLSMVPKDLAQKKLNELYNSFGFKKIELPGDWINRTEEHYFGLNMNLNKEELF